MTAKMINPNVQRQAKRAAEHMEAMVSDPSFQLRAAQVEAMLADPKLKMQNLTTQVEAMAADQELKKQADRVVEEMRGMTSEMVNPSVQRQAKHVAERMEA